MDFEKNQVLNNDKKLLAVKINELPQKKKPCYYKNVGINKGSYIRIGDSDEHMTDYEIYSLQSYSDGIEEDLRPIKRAEFEDLNQEKITKPVIVGPSMGGYVGQAYAQLYPNRLTGFVSVDSAPLQRNYVTAVELWLLKRMEPVYAHYPWTLLLKSGTEGVATSDYGRNLMREMMLVYDGDQKRYAQIAGHGFRILAEAMEKNLPYELKCPSLLICGTQDHAGSCIRYNKAWHQKSKIPLKWIEGAGHNSNTDKPELINSLIEEFAAGI